MTMIDLVIVIIGLIILALYIVFINVDDSHETKNKDSRNRKHK
jgi:hypothetical protein